MSRPNILYLHSHDTGRYVRPYGHAVDTPNLQRFAEQGVLFRQAFCAAPTCSASRAALLTGQSPHSAGMLGLAHRGFRMRDCSQHILHTLRKAGYRSCLCGMQHIANSMPNGVADIGYDEVLAPASAHVRHAAPAAVDWLLDGPARPFFLSVGFAETHRAFPRSSLADVPNYVRPPAPVPDTPRTREDMAGFMGAARELDLGIGQVLAALERAALAEDTLTIVTTDHGIAFPGMKCTLTDHGLGVMLILRGPDGFTGGKCVDGMVSHIDVFPTICELLDLEPPPWLQGRSVLPLVHGHADEVNEQIFAEVTYHASFEPMRAVRTKRHKYIRRLHDRDRPMLANYDGGPSKNVWMEHGFADRRVDRECLFDLIFDPNEAHNIAGDPDCADALADMRQRLDAWMRETGDPLLDPDYKHPAGISLNEPDARHTHERLVTTE